jgi:outer membrane protein TolC
MMRIVLCVSAVCCVQHAALACAQQSPEPLPPQAPAAAAPLQTPPRAGELQPLPLETLRLPPLEPDPQSAQLGPLELDEVLNSVDRSYPLLVAAVQQRNIASGEQLSARGAYDLNVAAENVVGAPGFYQTNRAALGVDRYTLPGGKVFGGYRIGRGSFEPWYLERETNDGGEFKIGFEQSLLQGWAIDKRRVGLRKADLARAAAEPTIDKQRISFLEIAAIGYWDWVAAGQAFLVARDLLQIAERRVEGIEARIRAGILKEIELIDNRRLIASRQAKLIEADRKFRQAGIELSLFLRDEAGRPLLAPAGRLPSFPDPVAPDARRFVADESSALALRPEPRYLRIQRDKFLVELRYAENQTLPRLDAVVAAAQDVGGPASAKGDKGRFEMESGLMFEVPLQRRYAAGQIRTNQAELARVQAELRFAEDRVVADVRYAAAGLQTAYDEYLRARESVELTVELQNAEIKNFELGNSNILFVNLREQATADARLLLIDALLEYFAASAEYRAALGIDSGSAPN